MSFTAGRPGEKSCAPPVCPSSASSGIFHVGAAAQSSWRVTGSDTFAILFPGYLLNALKDFQPATTSPAVGGCDALPGTLVALAAPQRIRPPGFAAAL